MTFAPTSPVPERQRVSSDKVLTRFQTHWLRSAVRHNPPLNQLRSLNGWQNSQRAYWLANRRVLTPESNRNPWLPHLLGHKNLCHTRLLVAPYLERQMRLRSNRRRISRGSPLMVAVVNKGSSIYRKHFTECTGSIWFKSFDSCTFTRCEVSRTRWQDTELHTGW